MNPSYAMTSEQITALLLRSAAGALSTLNADGSAYAAPVHFVLLDGNLYVHCSRRGQKLDNIRRDSRVCFTVWEMSGLRLGDDDEPCRTGTAYESVIINGAAKAVSDFALKRAALREFALKYTPEKNAENIPANEIDATCVVVIEPATTTGKARFI
jgi:nitroimidazol reductase NimA-like FMN-containing flavoprotein (pyridoxamine 5'-phosphate oxidase superfamily)